MSQVNHRRAQNTSASTYNQHIALTLHSWIHKQARKPNFYFSSPIRKDLSSLKKKHSSSTRSDTKSTALSTGSPLKCTAISLLTSAKCLMKQDLTPSFGVHMLPGHLFMRPNGQKVSDLWGGTIQRSTSNKKKVISKLCSVNFFDFHSLWFFSTQFIPLGTTLEAIKARQAYYPACQSKASPQADHRNLIRYANANTQPHIFYSQSMSISTAVNYWLWNFCNTITKHKGKIPLNKLRGMGELKSAAMPNEYFISFLFEGVVTYFRNELQLQRKHRQAI